MKTYLYTQLLFFGAIDQIGADLLQGAHVAGGKRDTDAMDRRDFCLRLLDVFTWHDGGRLKKLTLSYGNVLVS